MSLRSYLVRLGTRLFTFDELKSAFHRLSNPTFPLPNTASRLAYWCLRLAERLGALPGLRERYIGTKPLVDVLAPANRVYDAHHLHLRLNRIYDLPDVAIDNARPRTINVLVPAFEFRSMSAGFFGVFQMAQFAARLGYHVRLVMFDNFYFDLAKFRELLQGYPGLENLFDNCETEYIGERGAPLNVNENDICVATVWYSAHFAEKIHRLLKRKDFIYLIQDYEAAFYPGGSSYSQADNSYELNYSAIFSSKSLRDHFISSDIGRIRSRKLKSIYFNNACAAYLPPRDEFLTSKATAPKKRIAFYSRPVVDRNMFELAALVLCEAYSRGILNAEEWECIGMGLGEGVVQLTPTLRTTSLPRMNLQEYLQTVPSFDICLTLMASPHPSMIPMDLACSGAIVVTNTFQAKTASYLTDICTNIIPAAPALEPLLAALSQAVVRAGEVEARYAAAIASTYPRTWDQTFTAEHEQYFLDILGDPGASVVDGERLAVQEAGDSLVTSTAASTHLLFAPPLLLERQRTYAILGSGRGGTSMVAGVVAALGAFPIMPDSDQSLNYEDGDIVNTAQGMDEFQRSLGLSEQERHSRLVEVIRKKNASADVWGWKDPSADLYLESILSELRNPHLIFVCRDIAAIVGAHVAVHNLDAESAVDETLGRYVRYWEMLRRLRLPTLLVSYERGKQKPSAMLDGVASFVGAEVSENTRRLVDRLVSDTGGYKSLKSARADPYLWAG